MIFVHDWGHFFFVISNEGRNLHVFEKIDFSLRSKLQNGHTNYDVVGGDINHGRELVGHFFFVISTLRRNLR